MNTVQIHTSDGQTHTVPVGQHAIKATTGGWWFNGDIHISVHTRPGESAGYTVIYNTETRTTRRERTRIHWSNGRNKGTDILPLL